MQSEETQNFTEGKASGPRTNLPNRSIDPSFYIVFDLEWNQCPYGKERENHALPFEIIDIGAVKLDKDLQIVDTFHRFVRPSVYKKLHFRTKDVIGINQNELENGLPFPLAVREFLTFCGTDFIFATWGDQDLGELQRNLRFYRMLGLLPGPMLFEDIQKLFALTFEDRLTRRSLSYAADYLSIEQPLGYHRAFDDAMYTALIFQKMPPSLPKLEYSVDCYQNPKETSEEIRLVYNGYEKHIFREFPSREDMLRDREVTALRCPDCGRNIKRLLRWTSKGGKNYIAIGQCQTHGYFLGRLRIKHNDDEAIYPEKVTRHITEEEAKAELALHGT